MVSDSVFGCNLLKMHLLLKLKMAMPQVLAGSGEDAKDSLHVLTPKPALESIVCQSTRQASLMSHP